MRNYVRCIFFRFSLCLSLYFLYSFAVYAAVSQILNDNFYQNPATLNRINQSQVIVGNVLINPEFNFNGTSYGALGQANSNVHDALPYFLGDYRIGEKLVLGFNITPSSYGHLDWPIDSIVAEASTLTDITYYRFGVQASYQLTDSLALGLGFNLEDNGQYQINFVIPGQGNQINTITGFNYTGDFGLYYRINANNYLTVAGYTQVNTYGYGHSSVGMTTVNHLSLNITEAPVIYLGIDHFVNDQWILAGKVYWSGWSIQKNIDFTNTTTGTYSIPTNWKDVWSLQATTRYALREKLALLGSIMYETNPVSLATNAIGYPLAASGSLSGGVDISLRNNLSIQAIYSYGRFLPNSPIDTADSRGTMNAHFQAGVLQFVYKI